ncbi:TetR/AcrR family transcriptional regulator [Salinactinospora qingdaonensis]|uniref:TetR/AcrR family transcriptional regulator n=1 Tax=Salinactinospora qingdaonensis TaxID=702744 RepID=A0ABP7FDP2_9ACTN
MPRVTDEYLAARREHILAAAAVRFSRDGFHQTSMQDVIEEADLSPGAVYRYFRSKDDIIMAISLQATEAVQTVVREALETHRPLPDLMAELPSAFEELDHAEARMRLAVQAWGEALRNPKLAEAMREGIEGVQAALRDRVTMGQREGEITTDVSPDEAAHALLSLIQGFLLQHSWNPRLSATTYGHGTRAVVAGLLAR